MRPMGDELLLKSRSRRSAIIPNRTTGISSLAGNSEACFSMHARKWSRRRRARPGMPRPLPEASRFHCGHAIGSPSLFAPSCSRSRLPVSGSCLVVCEKMLELTYDAACLSAPRCMQREHDERDDASPFRFDETIGDLRHCFARIRHEASSIHVG